MISDLPFVFSAFSAHSRARRITTLREIFVSCSCQAGVYGLGSS
jgi:hypothetical protein